MIEEKVLKLNGLFEDAQLFKDDLGNTTVTKLVRNEYYNRGPDLFVLAIHDNSLSQDRKYLCKKNWSTVDCSTDCGNYSENCAFREEQELPVEINGIYSIRLTKENDGPLVIHLNRTSDEIEPNCF